MSFRRSLVPLAVTAGIAFLMGVMSAQQPPAAQLDPAFERLVDDYLASFHGVGAEAPPNDGSAAYFEGRLDEARRLLENLRAIDRALLAFEQDIDYRYLRGILEDEVHAGERMRRWRQDPSLYLRIEPIVSPTGGLLFEERGSLDERAAGILRVLESLATRVENARKNLQVYMPLWHGRSRELLAVVAETLDSEIPRFAERVPSRREELLAKNEKALASLRDFDRFLESDWTQMQEGEWRVGREAFDFRLRHRYQVEVSAEELYRWGRRELDEQLLVLERTAARIDAQRSWREIEADLQADHPSAEERIHAYHRDVRRTRPWLIEKDLVSIPWDPDNAAIAIRMPAFYSRLTFTGYGGAPRGIGSSRPGSVKLSPMDPSWSPTVREQFLRAHNYAFIGALMPHEVYPGHALVQLHLNHNPRKLRTFESTYSNQAWCYYVEWILTPEHGFYPPEKQDLYTLEMERLKLWRYARVIYDAGMHLGYVSVEEAVNRMTQDVMFAEPYSRMQVLGATYQYGGTGIPTWGYHELMKLRDDYFARMYVLGKKGTLKDFHDRFLRVGALPMNLMREALFHQLERDVAHQTDGGANGR